MLFVAQRPLGRDYGDMEIMCGNIIRESDLAISTCLIDSDVGTCISKKPAPETECPENGHKT